VLRTLGTRPWFGGRLLISRAQTVFDEHGSLKDEAIEKQLEQFLNRFVVHSERVQNGLMSHYHWAKSGDYVAQVTAIGPLGFEYVNSKDDPRNENSER
jgi:hypothetical protein